MLPALSSYRVQPPRSFGALGTGDTNAVKGGVAYAKAIEQIVSREGQTAIPQGAYCSYAGEVRGDNQTPQGRAFEIIALSDGQESQSVSLPGLVTCTVSVGETITIPRKDWTKKFNRENSLPK